MNSRIFFIEQNIHGAWVVYGVIGVKQYYYCTKAEARRLYDEEASLIVIRNKGA